MYFEMGVEIGGSIERFSAYLAHERLHLRIQLEFNPDELIK